MKDYKLKITAGTMRSRHLSFSSNDLLKPTKSYIRETIFNIIKIDNKMISLDLFSGSGILSAEAISRGIGKAILVEKNKKICKKIILEFKKLNINNYEIFPEDAIIFLDRFNHLDYNIIFIDPPYNANILKLVINKLKKNNLLNTTQYIYIEQNKKKHNQELINLISETHNILKDLSIGDVSYTIAMKR